MPPHGQVGQSFGHNVTPRLLLYVNIGPSLAPYRPTQQHSYRLSAKEYRKAVQILDGISLRRRDQKCRRLSEAVNVVVMKKQEMRGRYFGGKN